MDPPSPVPPSCFQQIVPHSSRTKRASTRDGGITSAISRTDHPLSTMLHLTLFHNAQLKNLTGRPLWKRSRKPSVRWVSDECRKSPSERRDSSGDLQNCRPNGTRSFPYCGHQHLRRWRHATAVSRCFYRSPYSRTGEAEKIVGITEASPYCPSVVRSSPASTWTVGKQASLKQTSRSHNKISLETAIHKVCWRRRLSRCLDLLTIRCAA